MPILPRLPLLIATAFVATACSAGAPTSSGSPSGGASPGPTQPPPDGLEHPTGAKDIVLRYNEGGGFMMADFVVTQAPIFTLYGDGTVVFRDPTDAPPLGEGPIIRNPPFHTAKLSEEQIQTLLEFAANDGALGVARDRYEYNNVADAGTAEFTINAGGREKTVSVYALGIEGPDVPDTAIRRQFQALAERLRDFDQGGTIPTSQFEPAGWRGTLLEAPGVAVAPREWPWADIAPSDFKAPADPNLGSFATRTLTADELATLEIGDVSGGAHGIYLEAPDGKVYNLALRPLLPDEDA